MKRRLVFSSILFVMAGVTLVSCSSKEEPKRRERVPPSVTDSTLPWNRPSKWEGAGRYGQMMPQSR